MGPAMSWVSHSAQLRLQSWDTTCWHWIPGLLEERKEATTSFNDHLVCTPFLHPSSSCLSLFPYLLWGHHTEVSGSVDSQIFLSQLAVSHILWVCWLKTWGGRKTEEKNEDEEGGGKKKKDIDITGSSFQIWGQLAHLDLQCKYVFSDSRSYR